MGCGRSDTICDARPRRRRLSCRCADSEAAMRPLVFVLLTATTAAAQDRPSLMRRMRLLLEKEGNRVASDQGLRKELLRRRDEEQKLRKEAIESSKKGRLD